MFLNIAYSASQFPACFLISHAATGRRRLAWPRNTLFLAVADFAMPEIHYFWPSQVLQRSKYTISGRRRLCNARNTLFLAAAGFATLEIHYFRPSQVLQRSKYTISGRRRFAWPRNTLFPAAAGLHSPEIHYFRALPCSPGMEKRPPDTVSERSLFKENGRINQRAFSSRMVASGSGERKT